MKPRFITFTGFDKFTDVRKACEIALKYPVEYGILFSPTRIETLYHKRISEVGKAMLGARHLFKIKVAAHLCGGYARAVNEGEDILSMVPELELFDRWQINATHYNLNNCAKWAVNGRELILQNRAETFPLMPFPNMYWLYDRSGGRGIVPDTWPEQGETNQFVGYAGGIGPDSVCSVVKSLQGKAYSYWLDGESKFRTNGLFDLSKVEDVCKKVYD